MKTLTKQLFINLLFISISLISTKAAGQITCGFDNLVSLAYGDSLSKAMYDTTRVHIRTKASQIKASNNPNFKIQQNNYVIPVVFHLVGSNASSLSDAQVTAQLNLLNSAFSNSLGSTYTSADDAQVKFCLAQTLPNGQAWSNVSSINANLYTGSTVGITRCTTSVASTLSYNHNMEPSTTYGQQALKNMAYSAFDPTKYLNIWIVERVSLSASPYVNSVSGYATFPNLVTNFDGIVMRLDAFGINTAFTHTNTSQGGILTHEAGHYLGLFHTFQGGCAGTTTATCNSAGDECCDTPPVASPNQNTCSFFTSTPPNSCSESPDLPDMFENHMDYQYDGSGNCRNTFTNDQADRIHAAIQLYRSNLVSYGNHLFTGLTGSGGCQSAAIDPGFISNLPNASVQVCTGQSIGFIAGSTATTYTWSFPGASPSSVTGTNTPTGISYASPGTYNVTLNITDASSNNYSSTLQVFVSSCSSYTGNKANWYFGSQASLSFSTGIGVAQSPSSMVTAEASAALSSNAGALLIYTNGRSVWNASHATMTNGNNTLNGSPNSPANTVSNAQGVVIVPRPSNSTRYYVYTSSDSPTTGSVTSNGISQYEIDLTTPSGTVISTTPVHPTQNYATNESIIAVPHCNGSDYWLITKPRNNTQSGLPSPGTTTNINQYFASYLIDNSGIANTPVLSLSTPYVPTSTIAVNANDGISQFAVSPDKKFICIADNYNTPTVYLYYFDCSSGKLDYLTTLNGLSGYGICFSPNSKVLYAKAGNSIVQYDLSNISACQSTPPSVGFATGFSGFPTGSLQLAPDGKIYASFAFQNYLGVINFPDAVNSTSSSNECGYNSSGVPLLSGQSGILDLPNDIIGQTSSISDEFSFCVKNCGQANFVNLGCGTNFAWNFGDGYSISGTNTVIPGGTNGGTTTGNYEYPVHTYSATGTYTVSLSIDGRTAITHILSVLPPSTPTITGPTSICSTSTTSPSYYYAPAGYTYSWTATNASPSTGTSDEFQTTWTGFPATLTLTITDPANGCTATSSVSVNLYSVTVVASPSVICAGSSSTLTASGANTYSWSTGQTTTGITVSPGTTTVYTVTGTNTVTGCSSTNTIQLTVVPNPTLTVNSPTICLGSVASLTVSGANSYTWSTGSTFSLTSVSPTVTTSYSVIGRASGCISTQTSVVTVNPLPSGTLTPNGSISLCGSQTITLNAISDTDPNATYSWAYNGSGAGTGHNINVSSAGQYVVTITNTITGCASTYSTPVYVAPTYVCDQCLVPNGDFEYYANLTNNIGNVTDAPFWNSPTYGSPDYYNTAASGTIVTIPNNVFSSSTPDHTGNVNQGYLGFINYAGFVSNAREYAQTPLNCTLEANQIYNVNLWARAANNCQYNSNNVGIHFSSTAITGSGSLFTYTPQVNFSSVIPSTAWTQLTGTITGNSENYLTIGNFYNDAATTSTLVSPGATFGHAYYFIDDVSVTPAAPTVSASTASCITSGATVTLTLSGSPGYYITDGVSTQTLNAASGTVTITPTVITTYTITPKLVCNKCNVFSTVTISVTPNVTLTANSSTICSGNSSTLTASGATTYSWNTGQTTNTISVSPLATTIYTVTGTSSGCSNTKTVSIIVNTTPTVSVSSNTTICSGQTTTLTASGATTYSWSTTATTSSIAVTPTATTIYTITGTTNGCTNTKAVSVTVNTTPTVAVSSNTTICSGNVTTLTASGASTYSWSTSATTASISVSPTSTTIYTVTGTSSGCSNTKTVSVTVNTTPTVAISNQTICASQTATLTASGASTYSWNTGATTSTIVVSPTVTTVYTATGTTSGCSSTKAATLTVLPFTPTITATNASINTCSTTASTLTASGATNYTWMPGSITTSTAAVTPTAVTIYTVSGQYAIAGCGTGTTTVMVNPNTSTLCCSAASLTIGTSLTSSVNMAAGNYTVSGTVIDMMGTITFTGNTSFSGYTLRMAPRTKLIVNSDYILSFTNCKLFSCSELWDGIYLSENVTKIGNVTFSLTTVEDMYNGVVLDANNITIPTGTVTLGHVTLNQSTFNKNYVGIQYKNSDGVSTGLPYNLSLKTSTISSNASTTSPGSTLKPSNTYTYAYNNVTNGTTGNSAPYISFPRAFIGIYLNRLSTNSEVRIGDNSNSSYTNTFDNMDFGIYGKDVRLDVANNYFKNITGSYKSEDISHGGGFPAAGPEEIGIAVFVDHNTTNTYTLTVGNGTVVPTSNPYPKGNKFEDCNKGVKSNKASTTYVSGNLFTSASTDIPVVTTSGSPPVIINNPNTYYFYKAQNAAWYTGFEGSARFYWNYVRNHNVGAYAAVSTGSVQIAVENNDIASPSSTGYCKNAVQLVQTGGNLIQASVKNNTINNVYNGVTANSLLSGLLVTTNTFSIETTAKTYNHSATSRRTGVTLNYCEYANVQGNSISGNGSVPTSTTTAQYLNGVYLTNSKFGKVECNSTTALGRDFVFEGTSNNTWLVNSMSNSYTGLEIRTNGVIGAQGALTYTGTANLSANTWTTITRQTNAVSSPSVNQTSKLYLQSGAPTEPTSNFASGTGVTPYSIANGGINVTTGTSYTCNSGAAQRMGYGNGGSNKKTTQEADSLDLFTTLATNDANAYEVFPDEFEHQNKQMVYTLLKQDSIHAVNGSALDSFYVQNQNTIINQFTEVREAIYHNDISGAISKNASVLASNPVEQKHQRANELVLKYLSDHTYQFTATEKQDLYSMANECLVKGYYVMQSRNVLTAIMGISVSYPDDCDEDVMASRKAKSIDNTSQTSFNLFPNPNSGNMQLDYDLGGYSNADVNLYDVAGKLIKSYKLGSSKGNLQLNEQNLHNGIYFYRILVGDKVIKTDKIVIIK